MAENEIIIPGATPINYYFRNYGYTDLLDDMPILSLGLANDLQKIVWKNAAGLARLMGDVIGPVASTDGNVAGFDGTGGKTIKDLGFKLEKNEDFDLVVYTASNGSKLKLAYDDVIPFYNDTGVELAAGTYMHLVNVITVGSEYLATFEKTDASDWEKIQGTTGATTSIIPIGSTGFIAPKGQIGGVDTSGVSAPAQIWLSATVAGGFTDVEPAFPDYSISVGGAINSAVDGNILVNITGDYKETFHDGWDGAIRQSFDFTVNANGGVITGTLKNVDPAKNLTCLFSGGFFTLDTITTDLDIVLVAGTDSVTQVNYVFIPKDTKVITSNTTGFPLTEHCKVAVIDCQSASDVEAKSGARGNQNWNDHIKKEDDNGHVLHLAEWIRKQYATIDPRNGCEVTLDDTGGNGYLTMTSGIVEQAHPQTVDSIVMPASPIMIANDPDVAFVETTNLNTISKFNDGSNWSNKWGKGVVWVIANKTGEPSFLSLNLPSAGLTSSADALADENNYADYSIPIQYKSKAVLLGAFVFKVSGGTLTYSGDFQDLRGTVPSNIAGGGGGGGGGATSFLALSDTPSSFVGQAGKVATVNSSETDIEFNDIVNATQYQIPVADVDGNLQGYSDFVRDANGDIGLGGNDILDTGELKQGLGILTGKLSDQYLMMNGLEFDGAWKATQNTFKPTLFAQSPTGYTFIEGSAIPTNIGDVVTFKTSMSVSSGVITAPEMTNDDIASASAQVLITKGYLGELRITVPASTSTNITSTSVGTDCFATITLSRGTNGGETTPTTLMRTVSFKTGDTESHYSLTGANPIDASVNTISGGMQVVNSSSTSVVEVTVKSVGNSNPTKLTVS